MNHQWAVTFNYWHNDYFQLLPIITSDLEYKSQCSSDTKPTHIKHYPFLNSEKKALDFIIFDQFTHTFATVPPQSIFVIVRLDPDVQKYAWTM